MSVLYSIDLSDKIGFGTLVPTSPRRIEEVHTGMQLVNHLELRHYTTSPIAPVSAKYADE